jgi:hypothetical protein
MTNRARQRAQGKAVAGGSRRDTPLEGNQTEVVRFLDRLSAVDAAGKERWRWKVSWTIHRRILS